MMFGVNSTTQQWRAPRSTVVLVAASSTFSSFLSHSRARKNKLFHLLPVFKTGLQSTDENTNNSLFQQNLGYDNRIN